MPLGRAEAVRMTAADLADQAEWARTGEETGARRSRSVTVSVWASGIFLLLVIFAAAFPGLMSPGDPLVLHPTIVLKDPGAGHLLGTDAFGRSVLALLVYGARPALVVGVLCAVLGAIAGSTMGIVAGFFGKIADQSIMRFNDILMCFPGILLALLVSAALGGASLENEIIAVAVGTVPMYARVARGEAMKVRRMLYIDSAIIAGLPRRQIIMRHVVPNILAPLVVIATLAVGVSIVTAASLSFLGLGPVGGIPDWGQLLAEGETNISVAWWISTFPGIAITLVVVATNVIGDWLRDRLEIRA